ncbi:hypothetical protein RB597_003467 [Gaeumannomyces tritici]
MYFSALLPLATLGLGAAVAPGADAARKMTPRYRDHGVPLSLLSKRMACGETASLVCYGVAGGTPQNLDPEDIEYAASYLRHLADTNNNPIWNMPTEFDCSEWTLPLFGTGTVLALAKHINPRTNSGITYYDLARTFDGGEDATEDQRKKSLLGACGKNGGQLGVIVDESNPAYSSAEYVAAKMKPKDIIIKLVRDPSFPATA